jgi:transcriptional regulator with XRE-family HTH domain
MHERQTEFSKVFARRMRDERTRSGVSQAVLAERMSTLLGYGVDSSSVTRIENGGRGLRLDEAVAIAHVLGVPMAALLRDRRSIDDEIDQLRQEQSLAEWREARARDELRECQEAVQGIKDRVTRLEAERGD